MAKSQFANVTIVNLNDGRSVCLSYGVPVAAFIPGRGMVKTDRKWSVTTSKHANTFCRTQGYSSKDETKMVPDAEFCALVSPLDCTKGR